MRAMKYSLFAILSALLNLLIQYVSISTYDGMGSLYIAIFFGTLVGLLCKYILDKRYIFYHTPIDKADDANKFMLYTLSGFFTTIIYWGTEVGFDAIFESTNAKYIGAATGLGIGYFIKYFLDKHFVFTENLS